MRFHCLMLVRDEGDVIAQTLAGLLTWTDTIWIFDTGSTDNTWEIVQEMAAKDKRIHAIKRQPLVFSDTFRGYLFDTARKQMDPGDWVLRVDGDEFYHIAPPDFVRTRVRPHETAVHLQWYYFRLTQTEADNYINGTVSIEEDRKRPIEDRRRFYKISSYAEPRMFKYRKTMQWSNELYGAHNSGLVARERIPIRHYPHRDPLQMSRRYLLRAAIMRANPRATGDHWKLEDWRKDVVDDQGRSESQKTGVGMADNAGVDSGPLYHWDFGTELPDIRFYDHIRPFPYRIAQRALHAFMLPYLDRRRQAWDSNKWPELISDEVNDRIGRESIADVGSLSRQSTGSGS